MRTFVQSLRSQIIAPCYKYSATSSVYLLSVVKKTRKDLGDVDCVSMKIDRKHPSSKGKFFDNTNGYIAFEFLHIEQPLKCHVVEDS